MSRIVKCIGNVLVALAIFFGISLDYIGIIFVMGIPLFCIAIAGAYRMHKDGVKIGLFSTSNDVLRNNKVT